MHDACVVRSSIDSGPLRNDSGNLEAVLVVTGCLDGPFGYDRPSALD